VNPTIISISSEVASDGFPSWSLLACCQTSYFWLILHCPHDYCNCPAEMDTLSIWFLCRGLLTLLSPWKMDLDLTGQWNAWGFMLKWSVMKCWHLKCPRIASQLCTHGV